MVAGLVIAGMIFGWYEMKISEAKREALDAFNKHQLEEVVKEKDELFKQMTQLQKIQTDLQVENDKLNDELTDQSDKATIIIEKAKNVKLDPLFNSILGALRK